MNKHLISLLIAIITCSADVASANNVLTNPSFETGTLGPWFTVTGAPVVTNTEAHTGSFSVASLGHESIQQNFASLATSSITEVSLWVKRERGPFNECHFYYDDATSSVFIINGELDGDDWNFYDLTSQLAPGKKLNGFRIFGTSIDPAYLDDFTIAIPEPCTAALTAFCFLITFCSRFRKVPFHQRTNST